jgi:hypothetical protein
MTIRKGGNTGNGERKYYVELALEEAMDLS